jgi:integrase
VTLPELEENMKRGRKRGDGNFRRLPGGSIEFTVSVGSDIYGKRIRKKFYGKTERECRNKRDDFIAEGRKIKSKTTLEHTVSSLLDEWLIVHRKERGSILSSTHTEYGILAARIKKYSIADMKVSKVDSTAVSDFFTDILNYSNTVRRKSRVVLNAAFELAVAKKYCESNPVKRVKIEVKPQIKKVAFTVDEMRTIINFAKTDEKFGLVMYIMLTSGIRSGEVRALTIDKFDFEKGFVRIDKAAKMNGELGVPKNNIIRLVPLEDEVLAFLAEKIDKNVNYLVGDGYCVTEDGFRGRYDAFFVRLNKYLKENGEKPVNFKPPHTTRHSYATRLWENDMPIAKISRLLGHKSITVTMQYLNLVDEDVMTEAVNKHSIIALLA